MAKTYTPEFRKMIVRLHEEEGRTCKNIAAEYGVSKASIINWCSESRENRRSKVQAETTYIPIKENLQLKQENEELRNENASLKQYGDILCRGNRLKAYQFIDQHHQEFGTRWLLRDLSECLLSLPEKLEARISYAQTEGASANLNHSHSHHSIDVSCTAIAIAKYPTCHGKCSDSLFSGT